MTISIIAAVGRNLELGKGNELIWHFKEDMKFFKETTMGHSVIMGRKTFESLPKALPNRQNIVISANRNFIAAGAVTAASIDEALSLAESEEVFIIGGGRIYSQLIDIADKIYLTEIEAECEDADTFFPSFDKQRFTANRIAEHMVDGIVFSHICYIKNNWL